MLCNDGWGQGGAPSPHFYSFWWIFSLNSLLTLSSDCPADKMYISGERGADEKRWLNHLTGLRFSERSAAAVGGGGVFRLSGYIHAALTCWWKLLSNLTGIPTDTN